MKILNARVASWRETVVFALQTNGTNVSLESGISQIDPRDENP